MTINRVKPSGWAFSEKLSSADLTALDINVANALDKRAGHTDTLGSVVTATAAGRIIKSLATGADADTTYLVTDAARIRVTSAVTTNRIYTLSNTNAASGDVLEIYCDESFVASEITIKDASANVIYVLGRLTTSQGTWAELHFVGGAWKLLRGDRVDLRNRQTQVLNLLTGSAVPGGSIIHVLYNLADLRWYACGLGAEVRSSYDWGRSWSAASLVAGVSAGEDCIEMDFAPNGNMIVATLTEFVFVRLSGTWSKPTVHAVGTYANACCAYDPIHSRYVAAVVDGISAPRIKNSPDGTTWTSRTSPFATFASAAGMHMTCRKDTGRILWVKGTSGTTFETSFSDDGGTTWSASVSVSTGITLTQLAVSFIPTTGKWIAVASNTSSVPKGKIFESADNGATWSQICNLTSAAVVGKVSANGALLAGIAKLSSSPIYNIVYSLDSGATWKKTPQDVFPDGSVGVFAGPGGFGFATFTRFYGGSQMDEPGLGVMT